jgi:hypothetical protein
LVPGVCPINLILIAIKIRILNNIALIFYIIYKYSSFQIFT